MVKLFTVTLATDVFSKILVAMETNVLTRVANKISEYLGLLEELVLRVQDGAVSGSASGVVHFPRVEGAAVGQLVI